MANSDKQQIRALALMEKLADAHHDLLNAIQRDGDVPRACVLVMANTLAIATIFLPKPVGKKEVLVRKQEGE